MVKCCECGQFAVCVVNDQLMLGKCKLGATGGCLRTGDQYCDLSPNGVATTAVTAPEARQSSNPRKDSPGK